MPSLKTGTNVCNSDIDKAAALNKLFCSVYDKSQRNITLFVGVSPFESILSLSIDVNGVLSQLRRLSANKTHGYDEH